MKGAGNQFLARAGFAMNEHGGLGRSDRLDILQDAPQGDALSDNFLEIVVGPNLLFQVDLLFFQLLLEALYAVERQGILEGDRNLLGEALQKIEVRIVVGGLLLGPEDQDTQALPRGCQRQDANAVGAKWLNALQIARPTRDLGQS